MNPIRVGMEKPLVLSGLRPEWTVSIRDGEHGFRIRVVDAKTGRTVREIGIRRVEGGLVAEVLHLTAESERTIPGLINCGQEECFRHEAFKRWATYLTITLRFGEPGKRYIGYRTHDKAGC
jgi:hypothetical protein